MACNVRRAATAALLLALALSGFAPAATAGLYVGIGGGVKHTKGIAFHLAVPVYRHVEVHYSVWDHGHEDQAAGVGYRFENGGPLSVVLGIAYAGSLTDGNLLRHENTYIELRLDLTDDFSCQISHYSTVGDDRGENLLLCGLSWPWPNPTTR